MSTGLFSIFNIAKRGLFTQQKAIGITNHNISNANTEGYSRQRAEIQTTRPFMAPSMNSYVGPGQLGTGVTISSIKRVRDEFIDFQVRKEASTLGMYSSREASLSQIENIYNEPSDSGLSGVIGKFFDSWQQLSKQPESSNARTVVVQQSKALADELNHLDRQLNDLKDNTHMQIKETIFETNNILDQIDQLNQQIMSVKVAGQEPNDLMDRRDLLLDKLSGVMGIDIDKKEFNSINLTPEGVNNLPSGAESLLVRKEPHHNVSRFSFISGIEETKAKNSNGDEIDVLEIKYMKNANSNDGSSFQIDISNLSEEEVHDLKEKINQNRIIWSEEDGTSFADGEIVSGSSNGEILKEIGLFTPSRGKLNGLVSVQEDVDKYIDQMDNLSKGIALAVNITHSGKLEGDTLSFFVNKDDNSKEDEIKASNISINEDILNNVMLINAGKDENSGSTDGTRALAIGQLRDLLFDIQKMDNLEVDSTDPDKDTIRKVFIKECTGGDFEEDTALGFETIKSDKDGMTIDGYFKDIIDELGIQTQQAKRIVTNQNSLLSGFQEAKESISGVSLDEEMANLIQFQHAYSANAKVVSTVDELLEVVINGLKR